MITCCNSCTACSVSPFALNLHLRYLTYITKNIHRNLHAAEMERADLVIDTTALADIRESAANLCSKFTPYP